MREQGLFEVASRYYVQGDTMERIARDMSVSRSTVSRLLAEARMTGVVRITLRERAGRSAPLAKELSEAFGVEAELVAVGDAVPPAVRFDKVARSAAALLDAVMEDDMRLGIAWGVTVGQIARRLSPKLLQGVTVVQMNGSAHSEDDALPFVGAILKTFADAYGGRAQLFPVPAFFDRADARDAMWQERSVTRVLDMIRHLDVAVFGVGSLRGGVPSHVYSAGYLDAEEMAEIERDRVVGDVCTVLLREDGSWADIRFNHRATGPSPTELRAIPRRICVVADPRRAPAATGALRSGAVTDFVCDDSTARAILKRVR